MVSLDSETHFLHSSADYSLGIFYAVNSLSVLLLFLVSCSTIESKLIGFIVHFYDAADLGRAPTSKKMLCVYELQFSKFVWDGLIGAIS